MIGRSASTEPLTPKSTKAPKPAANSKLRIASFRLNDDPALSKNSFWRSGYLQSNRVRKMRVLEMEETHRFSSCWP